MKTPFLLALALALSSIGCQALIGIEDTELSPDASTGSDATADGADGAIDSGSFDGATDAFVPETAPVCQKGAKRCAGNQTQTCNDSGSGWVDGMTCPFLCTEGQCTGGCKPTSEQCKPDARTPQKCDSSGTWVDGAPCAYVCLGGVCAGTCIPDSKACEGNVPISCDMTGKKVSGNVCPILCDKGVCAATCTASSKQCNGLVPQTCVAGAWSNAAACAFVCKDGACVGACKPGDKRCTNLTAETCDANGAWVAAPKACDFGCTAGVCSGCTTDAQCLAKFPTTPACNVSTGTCAVCAPGAKRCTNSVPQECGATGWADKTACPYVCKDGACGGECVPTSTRCSGREAQICDAAGLWSLKQLCNVCSGSGTCTGVCVPGEKQCSGNTPQTCSGGQWVDEAACDYACVGQGICTTACSTDVQCSAKPATPVCNTTTGVCVECLTANACGGCGALSGAPNEACSGGAPDPRGCGKLQCTPDRKSLACIGDRPQNDCGGCDTLPFSRGSECTAPAPTTCGTYVCSTTNSVKCVGNSEPNACGGCIASMDRPGTPCDMGRCWECAGTALTCTKLKNTCGGCTTLAGKAGDPCGIAGGCGRWVCYNAETIYCAYDHLGCGSCDEAQNFGCKTDGTQECCSGTCKTGQSCSG